MARTTEISHNNLARYSVLQHKRSSGAEWRKNKMGKIKVSLQLSFNKGFKNLKCVTMISCLALGLALELGLGMALTDHRVSIINLFQIQFFDLSRN